MQMDHELVSAKRMEHETRHVNQTALCTLSDFLPFQKTIYYWTGSQKKSGETRTRSMFLHNELHKLLLCYRALF
jgi:hypothetical protein